MTSGSAASTVCSALAGDTDTLVAHLKENDVRGDLSFIDRARGLTELKALVEAEREQSMSQREFSAYLAEQGYGVSHTVLNSAAYAVQSPEASLPVALGAGMSQAQVDRIRKLHKAFVSAWSAPGAGCRIRPVAVPGIAGSAR